MIKRIIFTSLLVLIASSVAYADVYRVVTQNLINSPNRYLNNIVEIEGIVQQHLPDQTSAGFFYLRDDFGELVRVRVIDSKPEVNTRIRMQGVFTRELPNAVTASFLQRYFIDARTIRRAGEQTETEQPTNHIVAIESTPEGATVFIDGREVGKTPLQQRLENGNYSVRVERPMYRDHSMSVRVDGSSIRRNISLERSELFYGLIAGSGVLLLLILGFAFIKVSKNGKNGDNEIPEPNPGVDPNSGYEDEPFIYNEPDTKVEVENKTVKIMVPSNNKTIKVLGEYFDVIDGIDGTKRINLYKDPNKPNTEYTFGRNPGDEFYHVQLKSPAVSRQQAKLIAMKDQYTLINYASSTSNPTRVNDVEMDEHESAQIKPGDMITMGDVKLRFDSK